MGKSRFTTSSRKKQHIPTVVVRVEQSTGKLSSALSSCTRTDTGKKEKWQNCKSVGMIPSLCSLLNLPSLEVAWERVYSSCELQSVFLSLSLKQKPQKPPGDLILNIYFPSQNLQDKSEHDSRGVQFPGHDPARTACSFACLFPGISALCAV